MLNCEIVPATFRDLSYIVANLRQQDHKELSCQWESWHPVSAAYAAHAMTPEGWQWVVLLRGQPVAAFGCCPYSATDPDVWQAWAFGTDRMKRAVPAITRFAVDVLAPRLLNETSVRRLQVFTNAEHDLSHGWLMKIGATSEGTMRSWGRGGEDFAIYAWVRDDVSVDETA